VGFVAVRFLVDPFYTGGVENWNPDRPDILELLREADFGEVRLLPSGSNYVFAVTLKASGERDGVAIYKPCQGENPLWDFPQGLHRREVASYLLAEGLGWCFIPPTVVRDGPHGEGMLQLFIEHDIRQHFFTLRDARSNEFKKFVAFDYIANNADRKGGHCLLGEDGRVWGIDHGLTFHVADKLRTVMWDWAGELVPKRLLRDVAAFRERLAPGGDVAAQLEGWLEPRELERTRERAAALLESRRFPVPGSYRSVPWPLV
jgi:uncharacterized repeat protein (TIGR03843 family)